MSSSNSLQRAKRRIMMEIGKMAEDEATYVQNGIYFLPDEEDIYKCYAMLVGCEDTPYAHGFYFFTFTFPENYPMVPPKGASMTQGRLQTTSGESVAMRMNPNLYTCGKLCLSILGTWSGPGWVPTLTIDKVFVTIQAVVFQGVPLRNEPAYYEASETDPRVASYTKHVAYANYKISILDMLEQRPAPVFDVFLPKMKELFLANFDKIMAGIEKEKATAPATLRDEAYGMGTIVMNYDEVAHRMLAMRERLLAEAPAPADSS